MYVNMIKTASVELGKKDNIACMLLLHPATVDTDLSRPYQRNVSKDKLFREFSVQKLLSIIDNARRPTTGSSPLGMVKKSHGDHCFQSVTVAPSIFFVSCFYHSSFLFGTAFVPF